MNTKASTARTYASATVLYQVEELDSGEKPLVCYRWTGAAWEFNCVRWSTWLEVERSMAKAGAQELARA